jgi:hypothetical protein
MSVISVPQGLPPPRLVRYVFRIRIGEFGADSRAKRLAPGSWQKRDFPETHRSFRPIRGDTAGPGIVVASCSVEPGKNAERFMTRRAVRIAWVGVGLCLTVGIIASVVALMGPPDQPWNRSLRELSTLLDVAALLFWIAIFAIYWARKRGQS